MACSRGRVEQLLAVLPFIERLGLIEALVALQAHKGQAEQRRRGFRELRLAHAGWALDKHRFAQARREKDGGGDRIAADVAEAGEAVADVLDRGEFVPLVHAACLVSGRKGGGEGFSRRWRS